MDPAVIVAAAITAIFSGALVSIVNGMFSRRQAAAASVKTSREADKTDAEAEAVRLQAVLSQVEPLHRIISTLDSRIAEADKQISRLSNQAMAQQLRLDVAEEKVGILERREREFLEYRAAVATYEQLVSLRLQTAGLDVPLPPQAPPPRAERTRRNDREGKP